MELLTALLNIVGLVLKRKYHSLFSSLPLPLPQLNLK